MAEQQFTDEQLWEQAQKDQTSTIAEELAPTEANADAAADPMAGLPEPTRKLIEEIDRLKTTVSSRDADLVAVKRQMSTVNGAYGSLKQRLEAMAPTIEAVAAQKQAEEQTKAEAAAKKRAELRERLSDFPDVVDYLDMVVPADAKPAAEVKPEPKAEPKLETEVLNDGYDQATVTRLQLDLADKVPGWRAKKDAPEFKAWAGAQSAELKAKLNSWDVDEVVSVFEAFEKHKSDAAKVAQVEKDRQERLRRGEGPQGRGSSTGAVDTSADALWNQAKREREKARQGA